MSLYIGHLKCIYAIHGGKNNTFFHTFLSSSIQIPDGKAEWKEKQINKKQAGYIYLIFFSM